MTRSGRGRALWILAFAAVMASLACSDEQWVVDAETPLLRSQVACGFDVGRNQRDAMQTELEPGQRFTVRRRKSVEGQPCWFIRTAEGLDGWIAFTEGRAHRIR